MTRNSSQKRYQNCFNSKMTNTKVKVCLLRILWPAGEMHIMWILEIFGQNWKFINYTTIKQMNYFLTKV